MRRTKAQIKSLAILAGLTVRYFATGKTTRYRFLLAGHEIFVGVGVREAYAFACGYYRAAKPNGGA